jgi:hypothetical protein
VTIDLGQQISKFQGLDFGEGHWTTFRLRELQSPKALGGLAQVMGESSYGWRIREKIARARPLSGFWRLGESR